MPRNQQGGDYGRHPEDQQDVGDIAANHVANGQVTAAIQCCLHAHRGFRRAGAEGHDGQADDQGRDTELCGQLGSAAHQYFGASDQQHQAGDDINESHQGHCARLQKNGASVIIAGRHARGALAGVCGSL